MPYQWMNQAIADLGATLLPITVEYADVQARLPLHPRDPFDRLLIAQAQVDNVPLISVMRNLISTASRACGNSASE